jgi:hypothetical protein
MQVTARPTLVFHCDPQPAGFGSVTVSHVSPELIVALARDPQPDRLLRSIFRVAVVHAECPEGDALPDICGRYRILEEVIQFIPLFPFEPGIPYRAVFDPRGLGHRDLSEALTLEFSLPKQQSSVAAEVEAVFPSSDSLPENLLRFYVCFSASMQRGRAEEQITILGPDGRPAPDVLYRPPVELWDRSMKCLTVLLDPGRLKRGVGPNIELGPPLEVGQEYRFAVGRGMVDSSGRPLREPFRKRFRVTAAVRDRIAVDEWEVVPPLAGSRRPLVVRFPRPLDWALLWKGITITSPAGLLVDGQVVIERCETQWSFVPTSPWRSGSYRIHAGSCLEDVCGNSPTSAFDRILRPSGALSDDVAERWTSFQV